jgi:hypothetical protein
MPIHFFFVPKCSQSAATVCMNGSRIANREPGLACCALM